MAAIEFDPIRLPDTAEELRKEVRAFIAEEKASGLISDDQSGGFSAEFSEKVGAKGWIGMTWPKQYGGQERSFMDRYVVAEEFLLAKAPTRRHFVADRQSGPTIIKYGTASIKEKILPQIVAGKACFGIGMSEPDSGSDLFAANTKATRTNEGYRINGRKVWTSNAHQADYLIALFRTSEPTSENRRHGLTNFIVDMTTPGISTRPIRFPNGQHEFNEVLFDDVLIPDEMVLGVVDDAWKQATSELAYERSGSERFLETVHVLIELINVLGENPDSRAAEGIGRLIAQLHTLRRMSVSVAGMLEEGKEPVVEGSIIKDLGTNWEQALPAKARDLAAFIDDDLIDRGHFDSLLDYNTIIAPKLTIQGGTREILRGIIARGLGLR
jgi:alkylation response protein AidB-like acyl-CoA dehydrogenase